MRTPLYKQEQIQKIAYLSAQALILLLAVFLRFHLLDAQSFWNDEGNSARLSERSIRLIIEGTASDIHPPLYYLLLRGWRELVGESEFALRGLSAFVDVVAVAATAVLAKSLTRRKSAALIAGLFMAVNPALIYYSQEARMYSLLGLWAVVSTLFLVRLNGRFTLPTAIGYVLTSAAGLYTHYFFPIVLGVHGLYVLGRIFVDSVFVNMDRRERKERKESIFSLCSLRSLRFNSVIQYGVLWLAVLLLYAPWLPIFLTQFSGDEIVRPNVWTFLSEVSRWLFVGQTLPSRPTVWFGVILVALLIVNIVIQWRGWWLLTTAVLLPIIVNYILGTTDAAFLKFFTIAVPFVAILLGRLVLLPKVGTAVAVLTLLALLPFNQQSLQNLYTAPQFARADYRSMAEHIIAEAHPNAGIILNAPNQWEVFTYYYPDETAVYPLPNGRSRPTPEQIDTSLSDIAANHERLYAIFWGEAQRDPERLVERWLDSHAFKATDEWVGDVRFVTYAVPPEPAVEIETAVADTRFGDQIQLLGYTLNDTEFQPGDIVQVTLFWQSNAPIEGRYKVFLHVLDENGAVVAQRDSEPGGGLAITPSWVAGETVIDNHGILLPVALANGRYRLQLGLYDFSQPQNRLLINGESDSLALPHLSIRR